MLIPRFLLLLHLDIDTRREISSFIMTNDQSLDEWLRWTWFVLEYELNPTTGLALLGDPVGQKSRQWRFTHNLIMCEKWW